MTNTSTNVNADTNNTCITTALNSMTLFDGVEFKSLTSYGDLVLNNCTSIDNTLGNFFKGPIHVMTAPVTNLTAPQSEQVYVLSIAIKDATDNEQEDIATDIKEDMEKQQNPERFKAEPLRTSTPTLIWKYCRCRQEDGSC